MKTPCVKAGIPSRICHCSAKHTHRNREKHRETGEGGRKESRGGNRYDSGLETQREIQAEKCRDKQRHM